MSNGFLSAYSEKLKLNQYWYSSNTIQTLVTEIERYAHKCCFLSTPSLFFSLNNRTLQSNSRLFDFDEEWSHDPAFVKYDFRQPDKIPIEYHHAFDYVVIDPPFITEDVWRLYAQAVRILSSKERQAKILLSTIPEHATFLKELMGMKRCNYRPSIPTLIYQYSLYVNYDSPLCLNFNPEIDPESSSRDHSPSARKQTRMDSYSSEQLLRDEQQQVDSQ